MEDRIEMLERRGRRLRAKGEFRKAANAYGELTSIEPEAPRWWVLMGVMLCEANRSEEAFKAYRQAMYLFRRADKPGCVESVRALVGRMGFASALAA